MPENFLIVGAGFTGCTLAERLTSAGHKVTIVDRRDHIGGNAYENGGVHRYGPHIFHTNSDKVLGYLSRFTEWRPYEHKVVAFVEGEYVPLPFNFNSIKILFSPEKVDRLIRRLVVAYGYGANIPILKMLCEEDYELHDLARFIYDKVFYGYTMKQWGVRPELLDSSVTARVPVRCNFDDRYFLDKHQVMPLYGYTKIFEKMLAGVDVRLLVSPDMWRGMDGCKIIYTGCIDEFFSYRYGKLPYRSTKFTFRESSQIGPVTTINYPNDYVYTRVTNMGKLTGDTNVLCYETPQSEGEPYYPVPCLESREMYKKYEMLADELKGKVWFAGRLGGYQYLNMDQAVGSALALFDKEFA